MSETTTEQPAAPTLDRPVSIENLAELLPPVDQWPRWKKTAVTSATRINGPFTVETSEGPLNCEDGWVAVDARGYPYPIAVDEFPQIYAQAGDPDDDDIYFVSGVTREGEPHVMIQWAGEVMQVPPNVVRVFAMNALESAETAESEAIVYGWLQQGDAIDPEKAAKLLYDFRMFRARREQSEAEPFETEPAELT